MLISYKGQNQSVVVKDIGIMRQGEPKEIADKDICMNLVLTGNFEVVTEEPEPEEPELEGIIDSIGAAIEEGAAEAAIEAAIGEALGDAAE